MQKSTFLLFRLSKCFQRLLGSVWIISGEYLGSKQDFYVKEIVDNYLRIILREENELMTNIACIKFYAIQSKQIQELDLALKIVWSEAWLKCVYCHFNITNDKNYLLP